MFDLYEHATTAAEEAMLKLNTNIA